MTNFTGMFTYVHRDTPLSPHVVHNVIPRGVLTPVMSRV